MGDLSLHRGSRWIGACIVAACIGAGAGCSAMPTPAPSPSPSRLIRSDIDHVFDAVRGDEAVRAVLVHQDSEPVFEDYYSATPDDTWDVFSVTKSVTSTLIGIAIDRGLISGTDATLGDLLPDQAAVLTPETSAIQLSAVLTHTANFAPASAQLELAGSEDWIASILQDRAQRGPGDGSFLYSEMGAHVLAAVVAEATGMSPFAFAREALFGPLGIDTDPPWEKRLTPGTDVAAYVRDFEASEVAWITDPQGVNAGGAWLRLRPGDLMRIGQLFLDEGTWEDEQVVSSTWVATATSPVVASGFGTLSYGYQWWVDQDRAEFAALGFGGTAILVDRRKDAVVVIASDISIEDPGAPGISTPAALALAQALIDDLPGPPG